MTPALPKVPILWSDCIHLLWSHWIQDHGTFGFKAADINDLYLPEVVKVASELSDYLRIIILFVCMYALCLCLYYLPTLCMHSFIHPFIPSFLTRSFSFSFPPSLPIIQH